MSFNYHFVLFIITNLAAMAFICMSCQYEYVTVFHVLMISKVQHMGARGTHPRPSTGFSL